MGWRCNHGSSIRSKQKQGIDDLLENILLVAEVMELKANPNRKSIWRSYRGST